MTARGQGCLTARRQGGLGKEVENLMDIGLEGKGKSRLIVLGADDQMREHVGQLAHIERMVRVPTILSIGTAAMVMVTMAGEFGLENKATLIIAVVVMVRHNGVRQDNCARQRNHYLFRQMSHNMCVGYLFTLLARGIFTLQRYNF